MAAGVSQATISVLEAGRLDDLSIRTIRAVFAALGATGTLDVRWKGGELDRLLDEGHAALGGSFVSVLARVGWETAVEVSYSHYGERGAIDILAWQSATRALLVVEIKTELESVERTLRKLDEKRRLAGGVARDRFGWAALDASCVVVLPDVSTARRRVARHDALLGPALPSRGAAVTEWLRPTGALAGLYFLSSISRTGRIQGAVTPRRIRTSVAGRGDADDACVTRAPPVRAAASRRESSRGPG